MSVRVIFRAAALMAFLSVLTAAAAIDKANNTTNLNLGSSWVSGAAPGGGDVAQWSGTVTGANTTSLGADLAWLGLRLTTPGGPVTINSGNTLTPGASGLDLSAASQDLTLNCALSLGTSQSWPVAGSRVLTLGNGVSGTALLTLPGPGAVTFNGGTGATYTLGTAGAGTGALTANLKGGLGSASLTLRSGHIVGALVAAIIRDFVAER